MFAAIHATKGIVFRFCDGTINPARYIASLEDDLIPMMSSRAASDSDFDIWQQDGASCHVSYQSMAFLESKIF